MQWTSEKCTKKRDHQTYWFLEVVVVVVMVVFLSSLIVSLKGLYVYHVLGGGGGVTGVFRKVSCIKTLPLPQNNYI